MDKAEFRKVAHEAVKMAKGASTNSIVVAAVAFVLINIALGPSSIASL